MLKVESNPTTKDLPAPITALAPCSTTFIYAFMKHNVLRSLNKCKFSSLCILSYADIIIMRRHLCGLPINNQNKISLNLYTTLYVPTK